MLCGPWRGREVGDEDGETRCGMCKLSCLECTNGGSEEVAGGGERRLLADGRLKSEMLGTLRTVERDWWRIVALFGSITHLGSLETP